MKRRRLLLRGITAVELVITLTVMGVLASAFTMTMIPFMNAIFNFPQASRVQNAAADLLDIIVEGDHRARGLRYAGLPCVVGGAGGGGSTITVASTSGDTSTLEYNYADADYCGGSAARTSRTVRLVYDRSVGAVTRSIDGAAAETIPYYVDGASDVNFSVPGSGTDLFHYFDAADTDLGPAPATADIDRVDIDVIASSGTGSVHFSSTQIRLKTGVEIKRYTT